MGAPSISGSGFTWVNRDAENLQSEDHARSVRAHIQKQRRSQLSRLKSSPTKVLRTRFPWNQSEALHHKGDVPQAQERLAGRSTYRQPRIKQISILSYASTPSSIATVALSDNDTSLLTNAKMTGHRRLSTSPDFLLPSFSSSPLSSPLTAQLDPFFPLPCHVTERDKSLLHLYFTMTPKAVYGTHNKASICPIRDVTAVGVRTDRTFLQWILLGAELYMLQGTPSAADQPHILRRKSYIYKLMNRAIADPEKCYSDTTFAIMAAAAIAAARFESSAQGRKHLIALRKLMEVRGGSIILQDMLLAYSISITSCFINIGTEHSTFNNSYHLESAIRKFSNAFQAVQTWNQSLRVEFEATLTTTESDSTKYPDGKLPSVASMLKSAKLRDLQKYRLSRSKALGPQSFLHRYIPPIYPFPVLSDRRCHFATLWIINKLLYDLRHSPRESTDFIDHLSREVIACEIPATEEDITFARTPLKPTAIIYILEAIVGKHGPKSASRGGILHAWDSIDPLEMVELATRDSHVEITVLLSSWLTNDGCDISYMTEQRLEEISEEISVEWLRRRSTQVDY